MIIEVKFIAGDSIEYASEEATRLAGLLRIAVHFKFNEVNCYAYPNGKPENLVDSYRKSLKDKFPIASN